MAGHVGRLLRWSSFAFVMLAGMAAILVPGALGWSKEGHIMTCRIAQVIFYPHLYVADHNCLCDPFGLVVCFFFFWVNYSIYHCLAINLTELVFSYKRKF